jgi:hypothetical protein
MAGQPATAEMMTTGEGVDMVIADSRPPQAEWSMDAAVPTEYR